jgi:hypothetical protein
MLLGKSRQKKNKIGLAGHLYELTTRALVAILLSEVNIDLFIKKSSESALIEQLSANSLF